jgi:hypothetical protein
MEGFILSWLGTPSRFAPKAQNRINREDAKNPGKAGK